MMDKTRYFFLHNIRMEADRGRSMKKDQESSMKGKLLINRRDRSAETLSSIRRLGSVV